MAKAIGIDLGTANSCVAVTEGFGPGPILAPGLRKLNTLMLEYVLEVCANSS
jgi:molecular chaperone DnaK (HSP70)